MLKALHKIDFDAVPSLHLFDTLIAPILNYNCEVSNQISKHRLEAINNNAYSLEKQYFDTPGEKVHLQLCRNILGVSNSVVATFGELGCYPLMIGSFSQMIKYWHRIKTEVDNSSLIYKVVSFMENRESLGQHNWLSTIKFILHYCGVDDIWFNPHTITGQLGIESTGKIFLTLHGSGVRSHYNAVVEKSSQQPLTNVVTEEIFSPEEVMPHPKAPPRGRKRRHTAILTDSPEGDAIYEEEKRRGEKTEKS